MGRKFGRWFGAPGQGLGEALFDEGAQGGAVAGGDFFRAAQERSGDFEGGFLGFGQIVWVPSKCNMGGWVKGPPLTPADSRRG